MQNVDKINAKGKTMTNQAQQNMDQSEITKHGPIRNSKHMDLSEMAKHGQIRNEKKHEPIRNGKT